MSLTIYPFSSPHHLKQTQRESHQRELKWIIGEIRESLQELKSGLEDCYALLAPIEPGSTLAMSTPRNEKVKGTVTRIGSQIVKGTLHLQLSTQQAQVLAINTSKPICIRPLMEIQQSLSDAVKLLEITLDNESTPETLFAQLRVLTQLMFDASANLKGNEMHSRPPTPGSASATPPCDTTWTTMSVASNAFNPHINSSLSVHITLQDSCIILWLRALEPVDAPVFFGTKIGLAIGTVRRLEHDEMDKPFKYTFNRDESAIQQTALLGRRHAAPLSGTKPVDVFVREKVRVESADPNLMSLQAKLSSLHHTIIELRQNLSVVMGAECDDEGM
ncbi:hypothetical protein CFIMG_004283RA [Ceratocystis fimbriata CBS 114723]|uniref:RAVE subunit 2/Rogdi n=2 Tax=Ceratocystis TaxID=5157 RepID=A0A2C5X1X8_9PEZI|nr:hypothetical protein CFIMG_004283RA [Ceratocystis fimbriata CBS 114723]